jgi:formate-dependent nitrite reductase membrane component NrfD
MSSPTILLHNPSYLIHLFSGYQQHYLTTYLAPLNAPTVTQAAVWLQYLQAAAAGLALLGLGLGCAAYAVTSGSAIGSLASAHWLSAVLVTLLLDLLFMQVGRNEKTHKDSISAIINLTLTLTLTLTVLYSHATCSLGPLSYQRWYEASCLARGKPCLLAALSL